MCVSWQWRQPYHVEKVFVFGQTDVALATQQRRRAMNSKCVEWYLHNTAKEANVDSTADAGEANQEPDQVRNNEDLGRARFLVHRKVFFPIGLPVAVEVVPAKEARTGVRNHHQSVHGDTDRRRRYLGGRSTHSHHACVARKIRSPSNPVQKGK